MIEKHNIIENIEKVINEEAEGDWFLTKAEYPNAVDNALENVAIRLLNTYKKYREGTAGKSDYISSLRNFMLSYQTELRIEEYGLLDDNHYGIYFNPSSHKYYTTYEIPEYIEHKEFVEKAFINSSTEIPANNSPYCLATNKYLRELTGFKEFKSIEQKLCVYGALNTPETYTTLVSMPTGGGKSLVTQAISYEKTGLSIVVVPTVSLAIDQERVAKKNIRISQDGEIFCYYSGSKNIEKISNAIKNQTAKLLLNKIAARWPAEAVV